MCGRFTLYAEVSDLVERFSVDEVAEAVSSGLRLSPRWNIAPSQDVAVVTSSAGGAVRRLDAMRWGLVPSWAKDVTVGNRMINARAESVAEKPAFRRAFATRRCLVPADGFYEWRRDAGGPSAGVRTAAPEDPKNPKIPKNPKNPKNPKKGHRTPFFVRGGDGRTLALAGLWERWSDPTGSSLLTCTIVTTAANATLAPVHDRMPVLVPPEDLGTWLAPVPLTPPEAARLLSPAPGDALVLHAVSDQVNRPANDGPELVVPVSGSPGSG